MIRYIVVLLIVTTNLTARSQSNINNIAVGAKLLNLPFSSDGEWMRRWSIRIDSESKLNAADRASLIKSLGRSKQIVANSKGGTAFGELDWQDTTDSFIEKVQDIILVGLIKSVPSKVSILYLKAKPADNTLWYGVLVIYDSKGQITSWMFSDGYANEGNPHGNINRNVKVLAGGIIKMTETAWGDNTDTYSFTGTFKISNYKIVIQNRNLVQGRTLH